MLITVSNFLEEFGMSINIPANRVMASIKEAQNFDLKGVLGDAFFYDIELKYSASPADADIVKLVEGGTYIGCDGNTVSFEGLAMALKYYTLARFRKKQPINDTNFGVVVKSDNYSQPLDNGILMSSINDARASGQGYLNDALKFIRANRDTYPLFKFSEENVRKAIRLTPVKRLNEFRDGVLHRHNIKNS